VRFADRWWCTFREAEDHGPSIGTVRVICSDDGHAWESAAVLAEQEIDLRDPKLSITSDGRLMLVAGGSLYAGTEYGTRAPRIVFSDDGYTWTTPQKVLAEGGQQLGPARRPGDVNQARMGLGGTVGSVGVMGTGVRADARGPEAAARLSMPVAGLAALLALHPGLKWMRTKGER